MNEATLDSTGKPHGQAPLLRKDLKPGTVFKYRPQDTAVFAVDKWVEGAPKPATYAFVSDAGSCHPDMAVIVLWTPPATKPAILTTDKQARKEMPIARGVVDYFPLALAEVAHVSYVANEQHNPGQPMHWSKGKSADHADCIARHLIERGGIDDDKLRHTAKLAWRALALLQTELEEAQNK